MKSNELRCAMADELWPAMVFFLFDGDFVLKNRKRTRECNLGKDNAPKQACD